MTELRRRSVRVLTVDDQAAFREAARDVIEATPGFDALAEAASGAEALALVQSLDPDLILMDVRMPDMDGIETTRRLLRARPDAMVVLISLEDPLDVDAAANECGAAMSVRKQDLSPLRLRRLWRALTQSPASDDTRRQSVRWHGAMTDTPIDEMGPIDYVVLEWRGRRPADEVAPLLMDLVDRGIVRILDVVFLTKHDDGSTSRLEMTDLGDGHAAFSEFEGASSGLLGADDIDEAASALEPGTAAAVMVWENAWAAPIAIALRRSGGQLVASGRIPVQAILASLDAMESESTTGG